MVRNVAAIVLVGASLLWSFAYAGSVRIPGVGGDLTVKVKSFQELRFSSVIRQQYDYSCGSAAVASLLSFHYDDAVSEEAVFMAMLALADKEKVRREGFSMLDMKQYLAAQGYQADGFRLDLPGLKEQVALPLIVLMDIGGFRHFVVVKGISDQQVLVGDPARGLKAYSHQDFMDHWDGIAFVIRNHVATGRASFRPREEWPQLAGAPLSRGVDLERQSLGHEFGHWPVRSGW